MALTETALLGIACMMANAPAVDREAMMKELTPEEQTSVQQMAKLCVPERLKKILEAGREENARAMVMDGRSDANPTLRC